MGGREGGGVRDRGRRVNKVRISSGVGVGGGESSSKTGLQETGLMMAMMAMMTMMMMMKMILLLLLKRRKEKKSKMESHWLPFMTCLGHSGSILSQQGYEIYDSYHERTLVNLSFLLGIEVPKKGQQP